MAKIPLSTAFWVMERSPNLPESRLNQFMSLTAVNALYNGFFGSPAAFKTVCPSGNCAWDKPYTTLALCSSCTNLTSSLTPYLDEKDQEVGLQLPNGFFLRYNDKLRLPLGERQPYTNLNATPQHAMITHMKFDDYASIAYKDMPGKLHGLIAIVGTSPQMPSLSFGEKPAPAAYECALQWCLQQSTAKMVNGQLSETVVNIINNTTETRISSDTGVSRLLTDPSTNQVYSVSQGSEMSMSLALARMLNGTRGANLIGDVDGLASLWHATTRSKEGPSELYENLASSLTNFMRTENPALIGANYSYAEGVVNDTHIASSWTLSTYPVMILGIVAIFALLLTRKRRTTIAKTEAEFFDDKKTAI